MERPERLRPTWVEVDLDAVKENTVRLVDIARTKGLDVLGVVKADGYGHGAAACSKAVLQGGAVGLAVAIPEEGIRLRDDGIKGQILVMGAYVPGTVRVFVERQLDLTVSSLHQVEALVRDLAAFGGRSGSDKLRVHVKIDTGMGRLGVHPEEALELAQAVAREPTLELRGLFSHLATGDDEDLSFAKVQLRRFRDVLEALRTNGITAPQTHILNSGGLLQHDPCDTNTCRIGISLYGLYPSPHLKGAVPLRPALSWKTRVVAVKRVARGATVSYGRRYRVDRDTTLAALPVGYADGFTRLLSHRVSVLIRGRRYPVVGSICMDQAVVDVGDDDVAPGDEVVLLGRQGEERATADEWAYALGTINYEIVCMIKDRVPRTYV